MASLSNSLSDIPEFEQELIKAAPHRRIDILRAKSIEDLHKICREENLHSYIVPQPASVPIPKAMSASDTATKMLKLDTISPPFSKGNYGAVHRATKHGKDYVVKISTTSISLNSNEPLIMKYLDCKCPYVICMSDFNSDANYNYVLIDYIADSVDMSAIKFDEIPMITKINICRKLAIGIKYIHDNNIIHLDLKPANIMISNRELDPIIIDFGMSCLIDEVKDTKLPSNIYCKSVNKFRGSPNFAAPDMWKNKPVNKNMDIYSLGVIFYHIFTNGLRPYTIEPQYKSSQVSRLKSKILSDSVQPEPLPHTISENIRTLIMSILKKRTVMPSIDHIIECLSLSE